MIKTIGSNTFDLLDSVKVRQAQVLMQLWKLHESGSIDEIDMAIKTISALLVSINDNKDKESFYDFLMDNLDTTEMTELSEVAMEIVNSFVKKNQNLNMNTKPSSTSEAETSL